MLDDIDNRLSQLTDLSLEQAKLSLLCGDVGPNIGHLPESLNTLKSMVERQLRTLQEANIHQEQYEKDVYDLQEKINNTQDKLESRDVNLTELRKQKAEQTVCVSFIIFTLILSTHTVYIVTLCNS